MIVSSNIFEPKIITLKNIDDLAPKRDRSRLFNKGEVQYIFWF